MSNELINTFNNAFTNYINTVKEIMQKWNMDEFHAGEYAWEETGSGSMLNGLIGAVGVREALINNSVGLSTFDYVLRPDGVIYVEHGNNPIYDLYVDWGDHDGVQQTSPSEFWYQKQRDLDGLKEAIQTDRPIPAHLNYALVKRKNPADGFYPLARLFDFKEIGYIDNQEAAALRARVISYVMHLPK